MANDQYITITGRLTADPELRFVPSGGGVTNFTIVNTPSKLDRNTNEWKDGTPTFWRCAAWSQGKLQRAENVSDLLKKGDNVIAHGILESRAWEDKEGNKRTSIEFNVKSIGKDLTFHGQAYAKNQPAEQQQDDPWGAPAASSAGGWPAQEPPF